MTTIYYAMPTIAPDHPMFEIICDRCTAVNTTCDGLDPLPLQVAIFDGNFRNLFKIESVEVAT